MGKARRRAKIEREAKELARLAVRQLYLRRNVPLTPSPPPPPPGSTMVFRDEDAFLLLPGSHTTIAQLGIPDRKDPPSLFFRSRVFPTENRNEWEPHKIVERVVTRKVPKQGTLKDGEDAAMDGAAEVEYEEITEKEYIEDRESDEGAVWPIVAGRIVNWSAFCGLITHIYNSISPTLKSPIIMVIDAGIQVGLLGDICQFLFEKFKVPAVSLVDAAYAASFAFDIGHLDEGKGHGVVVDVGYDKCDVTSIVQTAPNHIGREIALEGCGGHTMTKNLHKMLESQGFTFEMCEQLKCSNICEILPLDKALPAETKTSHGPTNPAANASTGANAALLKPGDGANNAVRNPGSGPEIDNSKLEDNEGVLDVASIVASGKTSEILAKKEKEKAEKAASKKGKGAGSGEPKPVKLTNTEKVKATFPFVGPRTQIDDANGSMGNGNGVGSVTAPALTTRDIEVGVERFQADGPNHEIIKKISDSVYRCISAAPITNRSDMWDNIMIVGNGSKIKGFKEAIIAQLIEDYQVKASTATIFASELPSDFSTPIPTGANTPNPHGAGLSSASHPGVNPLYLAAVHASNPSLAPPGQQQHQQFGGAQDFPRSSSKTAPTQTPTSVTFAPARDYLPEWRELGFAEAAFFGIQIIGHGIIAESVDSPQRIYMTRNEYNQFGPEFFRKNYWA